jgi:hypothetical protein
MPDYPSTAAERYRSDAAKLSEMAREAANPFLRQYYERFAQRYLVHADNEGKITRITEGSPTPVEADPIPDGPSIQASPEAGAMEEASSACATTPLQPTQVPAHSSRRNRRRRPVS